MRFSYCILGWSCCGRIWSLFQLLQNSVSSYKHDCLYVHFLVLKTRNTTSFSIKTQCIYALFSTLFVYENHWQDFTFKKLDFKTFILWSKYMTCYMCISYIDLIICQLLGYNELLFLQLKVCHTMYTWKSWLSLHCHKSWCSNSSYRCSRMGRSPLIFPFFIPFFTLFVPLFRFSIPKSDYWLIVSRYIILD